MGTDPSDGNGIKGLDLLNFWDRILGRMKFADVIVLFLRWLDFGFVDAIMRSRSIGGGLRDGLEKIS